MDIENGAVEAAVETAAPEIQNTTTSEPVERGTLRDSIERAFAKVENDAPAKATEAETPVETKADRARDEQGRFAPKEATDVQAQPPAAENKPPVVETPPQQTPLDEAPSRFSPDAKAAWAQVPAPVRGEVRRALTELETGISQYRQQVEPIKPFIEMAARSGTTLDQALTRYVNAENALRNDPIRGLEHICGNVGLSLRDVAARIMGQPPDQVQSQSEATIRALQNELAAIRQQVGGVTQTIEQQQEAQLHRELQTFAADRPRFEELRPVMAQLLSGGVASDLAEAYEKAERLNPAPVVPQAQPVMTQPVSKPAAVKAAIDPAAQTRKGSLSISGAPSSGSNPAHRQPSTSARDSVDRAFATLGL